MHPVAVVTHKTSRRLRIKIPSKRGDSGYFTSLLQHLSRHPAIEKIEANPATAGILLITDLAVEALAEFAGDNELFEVKAGPADPPQTVFQMVAEAFKHYNTEAMSVTGGTLDLPGMFFLMFVGMGLYQISRGNFVIPAWYTAFWYAQTILWQQAMPRER